MIVYTGKIDIPGLKPHVRDLRPVWLLEELGAPYETQVLDMSKGEHKGADYLRVHPLGKVPALRHGDLVLFESAAICTYIADQHLGSGLVPPPATRDRALYDQWMYFAMSSLEPKTVQILGARLFSDGPEGLDKAVQEQGPVITPMLQVLDDHLAKQDYILGAKFSVADIFISATAAFLEDTPLLNGHSNLAAYQTRLHARPAYQAALQASAVR